MDVRAGAGEIRRRFSGERERGGEGNEIRKLEEATPCIACTCTETDKEATRGCMPGAPPMKRILHNDWLAVVNRPMQRGGLGMRLAHLLPQSLLRWLLVAGALAGLGEAGTNRERVLPFV
jgi:hypothetical protein